MIVKKASEINKEPVIKANSIYTTIQWLITDEDGAKRFTMRRFEILPGGEIGLHDHPEEHEIYILQGKGKLIDKEGKITEIGIGDVIFVPSNEPHEYKNDGSSPLQFICAIPYL